MSGLRKLHGFCWGFRKHSDRGEGVTESCKSQGDPFVPNCTPTRLSDELCQSRRFLRGLGRLGCGSGLRKAAGVALPGHADYAASLVELEGALVRPTGFIVDKPDRI